MKEALIIQDRAYYVPFGQQEYCLGNKSEFGHLVDEGAIVIPWDKAPATDEFAAIKSLRLRPTLRQLKKQKLPDFIRELPNLIFLEVPLPMALSLQQESLPEQLRTLMITNEKGYIELLTESHKSVIWPDITLPNLEGLWIFNSFDVTVLDTLLEISSSHVPKLKYLDCQNDKHDKVMDCLHKFKSLNHLQISNIGNVNVLHNFASSLNYLSIYGTKNNFSLDCILVLQKVKSFWLNTIKTQLDCELFASIDDLKEINVLNSKKVVNTKALLECKNLRSIFFLDCKKPFKGIFDLFLEKKYDRLDIEYS